MGRRSLGQKCATFASMPSTQADQTAVKVVDLPTNEQSERLLKIRHSTAHVMAMAVQKLFPKVKVTIGPWIETG